MGSSRRSWSQMSQVAFIFMVATMMMMQVELGSSDINKDKEACASQLAGLATCLPYVGGQAKAPTPDCCAGLKEVLKDSKKCLCILIKDRNDPSLGLKINATLALSLPQTCQAPANVSQCPELLHLPPNDPDVKVFTDFAKAAPPTAAATTTLASGGGSSSGGTGAKLASEGGKGERWLMARVLYGVVLLFWCFAASHLFIF